MYTPLPWICLRCYEVSCPHISAPYSFDKEMLLKLLEEEKGKIKHRLEGFAVLLKDAGVWKI